MRFTLPLASVLLLGFSVSAHTQWQIQDAHTSADLRGIYTVGTGVAWASGTNGTVLRTEDQGFVWQLCAVPPGGEHLDFRAIQALDNNVALVMSSGKGDLSRVYKTVDGCQSWKLVFTNPDPDGFWDALQIQSEPSTIGGAKPTLTGVLLGDPVNGHFAEFETHDGGDHWARQIPGQAGTAESREAEAIFAASNSSLALGPGNGEIFVTGGRSGARSVLLSENTRHDPKVTWKYIGGAIPLASGESAGAFSVAVARTDDTHTNTDPDDKKTTLLVPRGPLVAVGGDYRLPTSSKGTAAWSDDSGLHWNAAVTQPRGYRSAVAYSSAHNAWIAVGPNGTDLSTDDGHNWHPLPANPGDAPDAGSHWNALALPFVVGPHGRIGLLEPNGALSGKAAMPQAIERPAGK